MKNITLSADEDLIERARSIARGQRRTLNAAFREWLTQFAQSAGDAQGFDALMKQTQAQRGTARRRVQRMALPLVAPVPQLLEHIARQQIHRFRGAHRTLQADLKA